MAGFFRQAHAPVSCYSIGKHLSLAHPITIYGSEYAYIYVDSSGGWMIQRSMTPRTSCFCSQHCCHRRIVVLRGSVRALLSLATVKQAD